jgi:hypothetical protein
VGLELDEKNQLLAYSDYADLLWDNIDITKNTETLIHDSKYTQL